jgi:hypothetical protein
MPQRKTPESVYPAPKLTDIEWSYIAGIVDGEGSVGINRCIRASGVQSK